MSFKLAVQAFDAKVGSPLRKLVLLKLADQANDDGVCWPSYETIAEACEVDRRSVMRHVKKLEEDGFLRVERKYNTKTKKNVSNRYHLTIEKGLRKQKSSSDNLSLGVVSDCHQGSDTESLGVVSDCHQGSDTESPKPITEPISLEPIIESNDTASSKNPDSNSKNTKTDSPKKTQKPDDVLEQTWFDLLKLRNAKKSPLSLTAWSRACKQIQLIQEKTGHDTEQIIGEWIEAGWTTVKLEWYIARTTEDKPAEKRFNINDEDWSQDKPKQYRSNEVYSDPISYHPSHNTSEIAPVELEIKALSNMTMPETLMALIKYKKPGETQEQTYQRLLAGMGIGA